MSAMWVRAVDARCRRRALAATGMWAVVLGVACALLAVRAEAAGRSVRVLPTWETDGVVASLLVLGDRVYVGGHFRYVGPYTGSGAPLDRASGAVGVRLATVNGTVRTAASDGSGGYYVGGDFTRVGAVLRAHVAHIRADGTVDTAWNPHADGSVLALAVSGSTVYTGGHFTSIGGRSRHNLAALDARTGAATAFTPNSDRAVSALAVSGSSVYAGGSFSRIGGRIRHHIAALSVRTGAARAWNPNPDGGVRALAVSGSTVYAGGGFTRIGGRVRQKLAALDSRTGATTAWDPHPTVSGADLQVATNDNTVRVLAVSGSTVYAGGVFSRVGGRVRHNLAALDASTGAATAWNPKAHGGLGGVHALAVSGATVYVGGSFASIGGQVRHNLAALDATTGAATGWNTIPGGGVLALAVSDSTVYVGGGFTSIGGQVPQRPRGARRHDWRRDRLGPER